MKELSIEQKAEAYDEAIKRAKSKIKNDKDHILYEDDIIDIFPELKESDGEKIRKSFAAYFARFKQSDMWDNDFSFGDVLTWIEEQGKKDEEILVLKDQIESLHAAIKALKEVHKIELKKQCEQKLVKCNMEWYDFVRWFVKERTNNYTLIPSDADIHTWGGIILEHAKKELEKQGKQKPAWSEEDEEHINSLLKRLEGIRKPGAAFISTRFTISEDKDWLKSLKDRVQPKQEWSEEDENRFNNLIFLVEYSDENKATKEGFIKFIKKLKSLRTQNRWKPSKEQIIALRWVLNNVPYCKQKEEISGLLDQIKDL